jgi:hypothetical protein
MSRDLARRGAERAGRSVAAWGLRRGFVFLLGPTLAGLAGTNLLTAVAYGVLMQASVAGRRKRGELDEGAYRIETIRNVGWAVGAVLGMSLGGIVGSVVPIVGNIVMSMVLGGLGGLAGAALGRLVGWVVVGRPGR